jgi:hypothetical protein
LRNLIEDHVGADAVLDLRIAGGHDA